MANWPLVLAGPILRKVTPTQVSVWVALSQPRTVHLSVYGGSVDTIGTTGVYTGTPVGQGSLPTLELGAKCHVAVVTANIGMPTDLYSYNVGFAVGNGAVSADLKTEGLLEDVAVDASHPKPHLALGYTQNHLPTFARVPDTLEDLQILHGSCRKGHGDGPDAMKWIDEFIKQARQMLPVDPLASPPEDPLKEQHLRRPHQLFLTGDQIYSDEIIPPLLDAIFGVAEELMGTLESVPTSFGVKPCSRVNFPPGFREEMMLQEAGFTTGLGDSHLITFGEFMAMYMMSWSNVVWPEMPLRSFKTIAQEMSSGVETAKLFLPLAGGTTADREFILSWLLGEPDRLSKVMLNKPDDTTKLTMKTFTAKQLKILKAAKGAIAELFEKDEERREAVKDMYDALPFVRRALANVPTYMIMDDHEVTDDWNVTREWVERVYNKPMGKYIVRNALASYVACQAWGNDPAYFSAGFVGGKTLSFISSAYTTNPGHIGALDQLFGIDPASPLGWVDPATNTPQRVRLHFQVWGKKHLVLVLDSRTQRGFPSALSSPALLNAQGLQEQIPDNLLDDSLDTDIEVVFVVAPAPVLGPPLIEETVWPGLMRTWDLTEELDVQRFRGYERWDAEAWGFNPLGFESFLARLARLHRPVVFLSGDVHYSAGAQLDYFPNVPFAVPPFGVLPGDLPHLPAQTRFIQFTSSAVKNGWPPFAQTLLRDVALPQLFLSWASKLERLGWNKSSPATVTVPNNNEPCPTDLLTRLQKEPVLVPNKRWPKDTTTARPPDWSWVMAPLFDERPDAERPPEAKPPEFAAPVGFGNHAAIVAAYAAVAGRHMKTLETNTHTRKLIFSSNIGWVRFTQEGQDKYVEQKLYSVHPKYPNEPPAAFTRHRAALASTGSPPQIVNWEEPEL